MEHAEEGTPGFKVARVIESYDLQGLGDRLESAWLGETGSRTSLRDLADEFNQEVLEAAIRKAGGTATQYDIETTYRILTHDDVSNADTLRKKRDLERDGVSVDQLLKNFVTHQSIHTYLTKYRNAELTDQSLDPDQTTKILERLEGRTSAVAESKLRSLIDAGVVSDRDYTLFVEVSAVCEECGADHTVVNLISQGGCDCASQDKHK